jgi:Glycosyl transferases group 1
MDAPNKLATQARTHKEAKSLRVAFSYNDSWRHVTERYLSDAFAPGCATHFDLDVLGADVSVLGLLDVARSQNAAPEVFAHLVHTPGIPRDLHHSPIPTISMDIDSFGWTSSRIRWSMLFDYVFVWHKSLAPLYVAAGHPKVFVLAHAVDANLFQATPPDGGRRLDLGWVGELGYGQYARRKRIIERLAGRFKMNEIARRYSKEETVDVYRDSKIVVNVSREEFPPEANMRCYEAMAGGALLITGTPTELTEWGFREGEHFVGWRDESEVPDLVDHYLHHEQERIEIARAGQRMTLGEFTFQKCRDKMTAVLQESPNQLFAPARNWPQERVSLIYLEYYYRYQMFGAARREFAALAKASPRGCWKGLPMMLKTLRHELKSRLT